MNRVKLRRFMETRRLLDTVDCTAYEKASERLRAALRTGLIITLLTVPALFLVSRDAPLLFWVARIVVPINCIAMTHEIYQTWRVIRLFEFHRARTLNELIPHLP